MGAMGADGSVHGEQEGDKTRAKDHSQGNCVCSGHLADGCWRRSTTKRKLDNQASDHKRTCCVLFIYLYIYF